MALQLPPQLHQHQLYFKPNARQTLPFLLGCVSMVFLTTSVALANYVPPGSSQPSSGYVGSTGTRSGSGNKTLNGELTALAPFSHAGQTTATHPTFAWYVPDVEIDSISFGLYGYGGNGKPNPIGSPSRLDLSVLPNQRHIMQYSLPKDQSGLTIGQKYLWEVTLACKSCSDRKVQILRTDIEIVAMPAMLQTALAKTSDRLQRANLYAKAGFWYDALAEALTTAKTKPLTLSLLEDLVKLEASGTSDKVKQQHDRLKQVVDIEQH